MSKSAATDIDKLRYPVKPGMTIRLGVTFELGMMIRLGVTLDPPSTWSKH